MRVEVTTDDRDDRDEREQEAVETVEVEAEVMEGAADENAVEPDATEQELSEEEMVEAAIRAGEEAANEDFKAEVEKLRAERDELRQRLVSADEDGLSAKAQATEAADKLARLQADWENYRRRTAQERLAERERATEGLVTNLLPAIDDLERACNHAEETQADNEQLQQFVDGIQAVHDKILGILAHEGVEVIPAAGEPFDPMCHQAVGKVEDPEAYDETVRDVYQAGYRMAGRVIRPSMVTVTYGGPKRPAEEEA